MATLYETLGVDEHATEEQLKRAYRKAAMRFHPDRNVGNEKAAHEKFQELKEAYAILSDPAQREVYDRIFAEEMQRFETQRQQEEAEREAREAEERAAREALYRERVSLAMQFASMGHNGDVVFGVLLGNGCDETIARQIADSAIALHDSRAAKQEKNTEAVQEKQETRHDAANPLGAMWFQFFNNLRL
jgi:curved DNA-binding protein CbpA